MVAREQQIGLLEREGHVVRGMAGRRHRLDRPAGAGDDLAVGSARSGQNSMSLLASSRGASPTLSGTRRPVRPFRQHQRPGRRLDSRHRRRMIAMGMGHEDVGHRFAAHRRRAAPPICGSIERARIDDRNLPLSDDVGHRARERERARIAGKQPPHAGRDFLHPAGSKLEALVERDVVDHGDAPRWPACDSRAEPDGIAIARSYDPAVSQPSLRPMMSSQRASAALLLAQIKCARHGGTHPVRRRPRPFPSGPDWASLFCQ